MSTKTIPDWKEFELTVALNLFHQFSLQQSRNKEKITDDDIHNLESKYNNFL